MRRGGLAPTAPAPSSLFRWECGPGGEIAWVDGAPRGALIGRSIARARNGEGDRVDRDVVRAFTVRAPFRDGTLTVAGEGSVAGEWKISGVPAFDPADGRFRGYRGIALRETTRSTLRKTRWKRWPIPIRFASWSTKSRLRSTRSSGSPRSSRASISDPLSCPTAIGPQEIVRQARLLLLAIDDLDFAAKLHSSDDGGARRADVAGLIERMTPALREAGAPTAASTSRFRPCRARWWPMSSPSLPIA